jgi:hypothetical protein
MMNDAVQRLVLFRGSAFGANAADELGSNAGSGAWHDAAEQLALVGDAARFEAMLAEATSWAERISVCVTAPQSQRGNLPWWGELLARSTKCDRIYVRRAEQTEGWLLHRLHDTGALRLLEAGGKQVAGNLIVFARGADMRVLLAHIPLERAAIGAAFGTLLSFRGTSRSDFARACRAQLESSAKLARIPTGSEIDALALEARRSEPLAPFTAPKPPLCIVSEPAQLEARVRRFWAALPAGTALPEQVFGANAAGMGLADSALDGAWALSVRDFGGSYQIQLQQRETAHAPLVLTLHAGAAWASGNALMLESSDQQAALVWRGGLLGHSRARAELLWSTARLHTFLLDNPALGSPQRVALIAHTGAPLAPQLGAFVREISRLGDVFGVEPPPTLCHALTDFTSLSSRQQTLLLWRALIGLGPLPCGEATLTAALALRDQGYFRGQELEAGSAAQLRIAELLAQAADTGRGFDRPGTENIRAIQPELSAYLLDDWLECLIRALPENEVMARRSALRLTFEHACSQWGLAGQRLHRGSSVDRILESALGSALKRGLIVRVGAGGVKRLPPLAPLPEPSHGSGASRDAEAGLLSEWSQALSGLTAVQRLILTRRSGGHGRRESLEGVAQRLGLSLERTRQIAVDSWLRVESESTLLTSLRTRLDKALAGARVLPLRLLLADDAWWLGVDKHLELAQALIENLFGAELQCVTLAALSPPEVFIAHFGQAELERCFQAVLEGAAQIATPAALVAYQPLIAQAAQALDVGLREYLREALETHLELDPEDPSRVLQLSAGSRGAEEQLAPEVDGSDSEARLRLSDAIRSAFRSAGTPLSFAGVAERVRRCMDIEDEAIAEVLASAPFVQRNIDQYGLLSRDVPGGHEAIAQALNSLVDTLEQRQRALDPSEALAVVRGQIKHPWSPELVRSLIASDPALALSSSHDVSLRGWEHARLTASNELVCPGLPSGVRSRFERLARAPLQKPEQLLRRVEGELRRLEQAIEADELSCMALARQLSDVYQRLLAHVGTSPAPSQQLAQAAVCYFIDALACDEDELDAPAMDPEKLGATRAVLAAVLQQLDLDWL